MLSSAFHFFYQQAPVLEGSGGPRLTFLTAELSPFVSLRDYAIAYPEVAPVFYQEKYNPIISL